MLTFFQVPESVLNPKIETLVGQHRFDSDSFVNMANEGSELPKSLSQRVLNMDQLRKSRYGQQAQRGLDIKFILDHTRDNNAERPHDKVYSVLKLLNDDSAAKIIKADYDKSLVQLNREISYAALAESADGLNLLFSGGLKGPESSWALDFTSNQKEPNETRKGSNDIAFVMRCEPELKRGEDLNAGGHEKQKMRRDKEAIIVEGLYVDKIVYAARRSSSTGEVQFEPEQTFTGRWITRWSQYMTGQDRKALAMHFEDAAHKTARKSGDYDVQERHNVPGSFNRPNKNSWISTWNTLGRLKPYKPLSTVNKLARGTDKNYNSDHSREFNDYAQAVLDKNDTFFVTKRGFVGLSHHHIRAGTSTAGDTIAVFLACGVPAILRRMTGYLSDANYTLIGGAYIAGLMRGELVEGHAPGYESDPKRDFIIT